MISFSIKDFTYCDDFKVSGQLSFIVFPRSTSLTAAFLFCISKNIYLMENNFIIDKFFVFINKFGGKKFLFKNPFQKYFIAFP